MNLTLIRELDANNPRDVREAYREAGLYLTNYKRVGKYKNEDGFIYYKYIY